MIELARGMKKMRVLAARFPDRERAAAALGALYSRFSLAPTDIGMAPLGVPGEATETDTLVAGRFAEEQTSEVDLVVREAGGEIVANVDERWTRPRGGAHGAGGDHTPVGHRHN